jgi:hypothetical protein
MKLAGILSGFQSARFFLSLCRGIFPNFGRRIAKKEQCLAHDPGEVGFGS